MFYYLPYVLVVDDSLKLRATFEEGRAAPHSPAATGHPNPVTSPLAPRLGFLLSFPGDSGSRGTQSLASWTRGGRPGGRRGGAGTQRKCSKKKSVHSLTLILVQYELLVRASTDVASKVDAVLPRGSDLCCTRLQHTDHRSGSRSGSVHTRVYVPRTALSQTSYTQHAHGVRAFYFCRAGVGLLLVLLESLHGRCFPALCLQRLGNVVEALSIDAEI